MALALEHVKLAVTDSIQTLSRLVGVLHETG